MNIEFVTYEQVLALKELGFDEPCLASYETAFGRDIDFELGYIINGPKNYVLSPLKQQVFRWFRENHNWIGGVRMLSGGSNYLVGEFYKDEDNSFMRFRGTYEEIENDCINELIDRIKEQNNG
jgi:hypothetical protein